jgi:small-conductance mechanosensitive channel
MKRKPWQLGRWALVMLGIWLSLGWGSPPALAQWENSLLDFPLPGLSQSNEGDNGAIATACVRLDGYCVFRVAAPRSELNTRVRLIETRLKAVRDDYVPDPEAALDLQIRQRSPEDLPSPEEPDSIIQSDIPRRAPDIYLSVKPQIPARLMSVTRFDASLRGLDEEAAATTLAEQIKDGLNRAREERQPRDLLRQLAIAAVLLLNAAIVGWALQHWERRLRQLRQILKASLKERSQALHDFLEERQRWNVTEAQLRFSQITRTVLWIGTLLLALNRFPYTRIVAVRAISTLNIPLRLMPVVLGVYVSIRLSFALINRLTAALATRYEITPEINRRMQLRVQTISRVSRGIVTIIWLGVGGALALTAIGLNAAPLLAGAGIIGVALSLPAQSLIKDAINGFFIILEDQYAVGDVITVHGIRGLVENINLRITQIRDEEGRLVTIPNSEIGLVANHSSHWSQADIYIPISYHTDVDQVLALIVQVGQAMKASDRWQMAMLLEPEVLGVEDFGDRGLTIRVWIKTQPLKQWDVSREYRRRLKVALDSAGIEIPAHIDFKAPH